MPEYQFTVQELLAAFVSDADRAAQLLLDAGDEATHLGGLEPLEDSAKVLVRPFLARGIAMLQVRLQAMKVTGES